MSEAKNARYMRLYNPVMGNEKTSGDLDDDTWYYLDRVVDGSDMYERGFRSGLIIKSPSQGTKVSLGNGEMVHDFPINDDNFIAMTECTVPVTQDPIDVTDNATLGGWKSYLATGFSDLTGSITRFTKFRNGKGFDKATEQLLNLFFNIITDTNENTGKSNYTVKPAENKELLAALCWNSNAKVGEVQVWWFFNIFITGYDSGGSVMEAIKGDVTFAKGSGDVSVYSRTVKAGDTIL